MADPARSARPWPRVARWRRYGPVLLIVLALVGFGVLASVEAPGPGSSSGNETITKLAPGATPPTYAEAVASGKVGDYRWGNECDRRTGQIKMPSFYAPPCVPVFTGANPGSTWAGVNAKTINVVYYEAPPGGLASAVEGVAGSNATSLATAEDYVAELNHVVELYGRRVQLIPFQASGSGSDSVAAQADAVRVAQQLHAFASIGGPDETATYENELASQHVLCIGCGSLVTYPSLQKQAPYLWDEAATLDSLLDTAVSYVVDQLAGHKAIWAGEASLRHRQRKFVVVNVSSNPPTPDAVALSKMVKQRFQAGHVRVGNPDELAYELDLTTLPEQSATIAAKLKAEGATTVIFVGDPIMPIYLTRAAADIGYFPEWVITGTVLTDTTTLGRYFDQQEWAHAFGISTLPVPTSIDASDAYRIYKWWYGADKVPPATKIASVILPPIEQLYLGLELAGPDLTPETFKAGMFDAGQLGGRPTSPLSTYGPHLKSPFTSYAPVDDYTFIWWNASATGPNEEGTNGKGLVEHVAGGKRYRLGSVPKAEVPMFSPKGAVTTYTTPPPSSTPPKYPPWPGSPAAKSST